MSRSMPGCRAGSGITRATSRCTSAIRTGRTRPQAIRSRRCALRPRAHPRGVPAGTTGTGEARRGKRAMSDEFETMVAVASVSRRRLELEA